VIPGSIDAAVVVIPAPELPEVQLLSLRVAGLPQLTRTLLTAERAGIRRFTIVAPAVQQAALRSQLDADGRLIGNIGWLEPAAVVRPVSDHSLVLLPSVILDPGALRKWLARVRRDDSVAAPDGQGTGPLVVHATHLAACITAGLSGRTGVANFLRERSRGGHLRLVPWEGMRHALQATEEVAAVERGMITAMRSAEDGPVVDRFVNRVLAARVTRWLLPSAVTPNQITVASLATGFVGAWLLGFDGFLTSVLGLGLFQLSVVLDHVDGEVARLKFLHSSVGKWLDNLSDHGVGLAVIGFLTWRVVGRGSGGHLLPLGLAAALGATGAFLVVFWWSISGQVRRQRSTAPARLLAQVLAGLANRDGFCIALWATVLLGRPTWFLWALACGANLYWVVWLLVYGLPRRSPMVPPTS